MNQIGADGRLTTIIHYTYEEGEQWRIACMPSMTEFHRTNYHPAYQRTNEPRAVTCPQCMKSGAVPKLQGGLDEKV